MYNRHPWRTDVIHSNTGWAAFSLKGERRRQEDALAVHERWGPDKGFLAYVIDGHGPQGKYVARFVKRKLPGYLLREGFNVGRQHQAVRQTCFKLDREIKTSYKRGNERFDGGVTLSLLYLSRQTRFIATVGDSPCYRFNGDLERIAPLHALHNVDESVRVTRSGGRILNGRILAWYMDRGGINVTRTIGDPAYDDACEEISEHEHLIPVPYISDDFVLQDTKWLLLTSDGFMRALDEAGVINAWIRNAFRWESGSAWDVSNRFRERIVTSLPADNTTYLMVDPHLFTTP